MEKITNKKDYKFVDLLGNKNNLVTGCYLQVVCVGINGFFVERIDNSSLIIIEYISKEDYLKTISNKIDKGSEQIKQQFKEYREYVQGYRPYEMGEMVPAIFIDIFGKKLYAREDNYYQVAYVGKNNFVVEYIEDAYIKELYKIPKLKEV